MNSYELITWDNNLEGWSDIELENWSDIELENWTTTPGSLTAELSKSNGVKTPPGQRSFNTERLRASDFNNGGNKQQKEEKR